jgi:hypothetical protein
MMNAGEGLERLNKKMKEYLPKIESHSLWLNETKPFIWTGDIAVARTALDIFMRMVMKILLDIQTKKESGLSPFYQKDLLMFFVKFI